MINQPDYKFYVVIRTGEIETGWEYRSDAVDHVNDEPERLAGAKVVAKRALKVDPDVDFNWAMNPHGIPNPARARRNPAGGALPRGAISMYRGFHQYDPDDVRPAPAGFSIPEEVALAGPAVHVMYRSGKTDPETGEIPKRPLDYIHDHSPGCNLYRPDLNGGKIVRVPAFILRINDGIGSSKATALVRLGQSLGARYIDEEGYEVDAAVGGTLPELYTIPSGKALLIIQNRTTVKALIWGGRLGVEPRGIVH